MIDHAMSTDPLLRRAGWSTPLMPRFDDASTSTFLGHSRGGCRRQRQGRCPDPSLCADCAWTEVEKN